MCADFLLVYAHHIHWKEHFHIWHKWIPTVIPNRRSTGSSTIVSIITIPLMLGWSWRITFVGVNNYAKIIGCSAGPSEAPQGWGGWLEWWRCRRQRDRGAWRSFRTKRRKKNWPLFWVIRMGSRGTFILWRLGSIAFKLFEGIDL